MDVIEIDFDVEENTLTSKNYEEANLLTYAKYL